MLMLVLLLVMELKSQCSCHAKTAIVGRTSAKANDDFIRSSPRGIEHHFANPKCVCPEWIALVFGDAAHSRRFTHFHHGEPPFFDPRITRLDRGLTDHALCIST